ncbi:MAG TPA: hypothetical protein VEZ11_04415 [Thermoanaerobaculia bacterium]|nr:hypothetical protein [Thermoanaerobaculia bacterium]
MRRILPAVLALSVVLLGCRAKEALDKAAIKKDLENRGTIDLMKEAAKDKYTPPADGKLTDSQIQMYLKVREHEKQIAQVAKQQLKEHADAAKKAGDNSIGGLVEGFKGLSSAAELITADVRAAKDLGLNTQEYLWVKGKILEASTSAMAQQTASAMNASLDASYQQMKKSYDEAKDEQTKKALGDTLAAYEKSRSEMAANQPKEDSALAYNRQLLSKYENAINAVFHEASKYEEKEGDASKAADQWQKDMNKATENAKKSGQ